MTEQTILSRHRDKIAFYIATGGWDDRKKRFDDVDGDDYAKADAIIDYLEPIINNAIGLNEENRKYGG